MMKNQPVVSDFIQSVFYLIVEEMKGCLITYYIHLLKHHSMRPENKVTIFIKFFQPDNRSNNK